ncbi:MAG TPA: hypothetical protein VMV49_09350 [Candidatus Deferrimicrobium sp.]|nr:hypothetical protein [Candidatus Deferrimicrobium sp.]
MKSSEEAEFQELREEITGTDPIVRGVAAVDLGSFALDYPIYQTQIIRLLEQALNDPDADVRDSAKKSLDLIAGKEVVEPTKQVIGFGYLPQEYQEKPEVNQKQIILNCVCCIVMIVTIVLVFTFFIF